MSKLYLLILPFMVSFFLSPLYANDCATAVPLTSVVLASQGVQSSTLAGAGFSGVAQCTGPGNRDDRWFQFQAVASTQFIRVEPTGDANLAIQAFASCGGASLGCRNAAGVGAPESLVLQGLTPGLTYRFSVFHVGDVPAVNSNFTVVVGHVPFVELRPTDCDQFGFTTNSIIRSLAPAQSSFTVTGYQWRFEELEAPFNVYERISPNGTNPNYRLEWFSEIQYGRTYDVSVRVLVTQNNAVGDYGNTCTIGLQPNVLSTQLQAQFANQVYNFCDVVGADAVGGASQYRWTFNDLSTTVEAFGDGNSRLFRLQTVPGLRLGQVYIVSAFATVNGDESPQGIQRFITMNGNVPNTGIQQLIYPCGGTYPINSALQAVEVCSAQSYTWRFNNTSQAQPTLFFTRSDGSRFIRLDDVSGLNVGDSYNVDVRAAQGNVLGNYSTICNITIGAPITNALFAQSSSVPEQMYHVEAPQLTNEIRMEVNVPNNNGDAKELSIEITQEESALVRMELYDLNGRMMASRQEYVSGSQRINWVPSGVSRGLYLLRVSNGNEAVSHKVLF